MGMSKTNMVSINESSYSFSSCSSCGWTLTSIVSSKFPDVVDDH
jgi:hypothetical protein